MTNNISARIPTVAILLAAGRGARLRPLTNQDPKPLLIYKGQPIIDYAFKALTAAGIHRVVVITGYLGERVMKHVSDRFSSSHSIVYCQQEKLRGTADAVLAARNISIPSNRPILISATDYALPVDYYRQFVNFHVAHSDPISISVREIPHGQASVSSLVVSGPDGRVFRIIEKPRNVPPGPSLAASLIYLVPALVFEYAERTPVSKRHEVELPDTINLMIGSGHFARGFVQSSLVNLDRELQGPSEM